MSLYGYSGMCVMAPPPPCSQSPTPWSRDQVCIYLSEPANLSLLYVRESVNISSLATFSLSSLLSASTPERFTSSIFQENHVSASN